jgi:hypothetical protein
VFGLIPQFIVHSSFTCLILVISGSVMKEVKLSLMVVSLNLVFPNYRQILIFGIREREIGIPEIISYSVFFITFYLHLFK